MCLDVIGNSPGLSFTQIYDAMRGISCILVSYIHIYLWANYLESLQWLVSCHCCPEYFGRGLITWISNNIAVTATTRKSRRIFLWGIAASVVSTWCYREYNIWACSYPAIIRLISALISTAETIFNIYIWTMALWFNEAHIEERAAAQRRTMRINTQMYFMQGIVAADNNEPGPQRDEPPGDIPPGDNPPGDRYTNVVTNDYMTTVRRRQQQPNPAPPAMQIPQWQNIPVFTPE